MTHRVGLGLAAAAVLAAGSAGAATLTVEGGKIAVPAVGKDGVRVFKGLPYAAPPTGAMRWKAPAPVVAWQGVREVSAFGADCLQPGPSRTGNPMSEDCLFLNIWTPPNAKKAPVFVWIHGGGSRVGSGAEPQFDGAALARQGVMVVTINYRLGLFGWMSSTALSAESGYRASGNYGAMDAIAALKWVKANIAAFGGDPDKVTVGGESAGSVITSVLTVSPLAKGLFHQAIGESGSAFREVDSGSMGAADIFAEEAKGDALMAAMKASDLADLRAAHAKALSEAADTVRGNFNRPVVDGHVMPASPQDLVEAGKMNDVALLVGSNAQEGSLNGMGKMESVADLLVGFYGPAAGEVAPYYKSYPDPVDAGVAIVGEHGISWPTWQWGMGEVRKGTKPVYVYQFDHAPPIPPEQFAGMTRGKTAGAYHGSEMVYVFNTLAAQPKWAVTDVDHKVADQMSAYWANFIKTGSPDGPGLPVWPKYDPAKPMRMQIGENTGAIPDPDYEKFNVLAKARVKAGPAGPFFER